MNNKNQHGYLILVAISAYTSHLAGAELTSGRGMIRAGLTPGASAAECPG